MNSLSLAEGTSVHVIEEDDGSGWVKVADSQGGKGLVPASYIKLVNEADSEPVPPPLRSNTRPQRGSGKRGKHYPPNGVPFVRLRLFTEFQCGDCMSTTRKAQMNLASRSAN
jgi:uncharacterized protein YgiM (DUF1202 family)